MVRKFKSASISTKLIVSFSLIILLFVGQIAIYHTLTDEIIFILEHNNSFMQARQELVLEFHQIFTEMRLFIRNTFMSQSWRVQSGEEEWLAHQRMLREYAQRLHEMVEDFVQLVETDTRFPNDGCTSCADMMQEIDMEITNIYLTMNTEFFIGGNQTFNAYRATESAEIIADTLIDVRNVIASNRAIFLNEIERSHRLISRMSVVSVVSAGTLAVFLAAVMIRSFKNTAREIEERARLVARGDLDGAMGGGNEISSAFAKVVGSFSSFVTGIREIYEKRESGDDGARMDAGSFEGVQKDAATAINSLLDLTDSLARKQALSDMRMRRMYETTPLFIEYWNDDLALVDCNPYTVRFFGFDTKEDYMRDYIRVFPKRQPCGADSLEYWSNHLKLVFKGIDAQFELALVGADGSAVHAEVLGYLFDIGGEKMAVTYARDITSTKLMMEEKEKAKIAEENSAAKSRFLASMSHEIRTPISAVMGISEIQLRNPQLPLDIQEAFAKIHDSSRILLNIINDILDISKVEAGKMPIIVEKYGLASLVGDTTQLNLVYLGSKQIRFESVVDENAPAYLHGDELRIKQIINNIVSNAFKYTDFGSVVFSVGCEGCAAADFGDGDPVTLVIGVKDTGRGMTKRQLESLREEYTRFHEEASRATQGTGLGMAIVSKMIGLMQGEMSVESVVDVGTTVTVKIPQRAAGSQKLGRAAAEALRRHDPNALAGKQKAGFSPVPMPYGRVLVVDDVDTNLYVARSLLNFYQINVETASNGYAALDKLEGGDTYDIVFMDHMMPGIDGIETTKILRRNGYREPIVALTANALIGQAEEFLKNGFDGFISKPIQTTHLDAILRKFIKDKHCPDSPAEEGEAPAEADGGFDDYMQNSEILQVVYREFLDTQAGVAGEIRAALDGGDFQTAQRLAHSLKGLAGLLGDERLVELSGASEKTFRANERDDALLDELEAGLAQAIAGIREKIGDGE